MHNRRRYTMHTMYNVEVGHLSRNIRDRYHLTEDTVPFFLVHNQRIYRGRVWDGYTFCALVVRRISEIVDGGRGWRWR